mmetsp:Transcript_61681/g.73214  ORF Transcript_61681/g.73214 Transcript_61681/m.73214 type:complete len:86 (-) Transcript_61681:12-269(-)
MCDKWRGSTGMNNRSYNGDGKQQQKMILTMSDGKAFRRCMTTMYNERRTTAINNNNDDEGWWRVTAARYSNKQRQQTKVKNKGGD